MIGMLEVIDGGIGNGIQDAGRFGFRHMGITVSGWLDPLLARCANALVGNGPDCACIEIRGAGPTLGVRHGRVRVAVAGDMTLTVHRANGQSFPLPAWESLVLDPQDALETGFLAGGTAYLAVGGGVATPLQLGSRSTYQRARIGGVNGHLLVSGDVLPCGALGRNECREYQAPPWQHVQGAVRVMLGPQDGHFKPESLQLLLSSEYQVTPQMDRMGMRLDGPALAHIRPEAADIVSDGVTPGVIQVPGNGLPIILLADCQTVGGYPKIATVISADLPRLAQLKPGQTVRFCAVSAVEARAARAESEERWCAWVQQLTYGLHNASSVGDDVDAFWNAAG